jgi:hypothetical protein
MGWFNNTWDGVHQEGCPCYNESDVDEPLVDEINCRCYEIMTANKVDAADHLRDDLDK